MNYKKKILEEKYKQPKITNIKLYEGLIKSVSKEGVIQFIEHYIDKYQGNIRGEKRDNTNDVYVFVSDPSTFNAKRFLAAINNFGWFVSSYRDVNNKYKKFNELQFLTDDILKIVLEAKYDLEILEGEFPKYLYHATDRSHLDKILKIGLTPKSKSKIAYHPERIYFVETEEDAKDIGESLTKKEYIVILKINPKKVLPNFRLFRDSKSVIYGGLYTLDNVHPNAIEVIE